MSKEIERVSKFTSAIETASANCAPSLLAKLPAMEQSFALARGVREIQRALTDDIMREAIMPLKGTPLGFVTDEATRKAGDYSIQQVRAVLTEALIRGLRPVGNEFNIISGRCYPAKEGLYRLVIEWPGLTGFHERYGVPATVNGGALVPCCLSWELNGVPDSLTLDVAETKTGRLDERIPVRVNAGMGTDAIVGKAQRKAYAKVYRRLSGMSIPDGEVDDVIARPPAVSKMLAGPSLPSPDSERPMREPGEEG